MCYLVIQLPLWKCPVIFLLLLFVYVYVCNGSTESPNVSQNTTIDSKTPLHLLSLLPYPDPVNPPSWSEGPSIAVAGQLAVDLINKIPTILPDHHLELVIGDSGCELVSKIALATGRHALRGDKAIAGVVGPGCSVSAQFVASLISHKDADIISVHLAGSIQLSDRQLYPNSFGTLDSTLVFVDTLLTLAHQNKWQRIVILHDASLLSSSLTLKALKERVVAGNETLKNISSLAVYHTYFPSQEIIDLNTRVIVLLVGVDMFGKILCVGYHEGILYESYQWVVVGRTLDDISPLNFTYHRVRFSCDKEDIRKAVNKSIFINYVIRPFNVSEQTVSGLSYTQFIDYYSELIEIQNGKLEKGEKLLEMSYWGSAYFDAVWSLALALSNSRDEIKNRTGLDLSQYSYGNSAATSIIKRNLFKLDYKGISGPIQFSQASGFVQRNVYIYQVQNNTMTLVEYFNGTDIMLLGKFSVDYVDDSFNLVTSKISLTLGIFFTLVSLTAVLLLMASQVSVIVYRNSPSVKASSTQFLHVSFVGCYLITLSCFSQIIASSFDMTPQTKCNLLQVYHIVVFPGLTLVFGSLSAKTWRIYRIFVHYLDPGSFISNKVLFSYIAALILIEAPVLLAWTICEPLSPKENLLHEVGMIFYQCTSANYTVWFGVLAGYNSCLMLLSLLLALFCHQIPNRNFKTNSNIILIYILIIDIALGVPIYFSIPVSYGIVPKFVISIITLNIMLYACLVFLFWIPLFPVFKEMAVCQRSKPHQK